MQEIRQVLDFWFSAEARERWFDARPAFDQRLRKTFAQLYARAATGDLQSWQNTAEGCLALVILLDQMPRNMFRGDARAFSTDPKALRVAEHALAQGFDHHLPAERKQFLYLPFMHSESVANQLRALALCERAGLSEARRSAEDHLRIIRRFGRFPHRNAVLGRRSSEVERAFLEERPGSFGQAAARRPATAGHDDGAPPSGPGDRRSRRSGS